MAKKIDLSKFKQKLLKVLDEQKSEAYLKQIAVEFANVIRDRTRLGYGVNEQGGSKVKLKALSPVTIEARRYKKKRGELSDKTSPTKSNLTDTGQLLDSLKGRAINKLIQISPEGSRKGSSLSNAAVASYVEDAGRTFLDLSSQDIKKLTSMVQDQLNEIVNKTFK